jgi:hypothetical protein
MGKVSAGATMSLDGFIADPALPPMELEGPALVVPGTGVTHLRYRVIK